MDQDKLSPSYPANTPGPDFSAAAHTTTDSRKEAHRRAGNSQFETMSVDSGPQVVGWLDVGWLRLACRWLRLAGSHRRVFIAQFTSETCWVNSCRFFCDSISVLVYNSPWFRRPSSLSQFIHFTSEIVYFLCSPSDLIQCIQSTPFCWSPPLA